MNFSNSSRSWISQKKDCWRGEKKGDILKAKLCTNTALPDFNCLYQSDLDKKCGTGIQVTFMPFFFKKRLSLSFFRASFFVFYLLISKCTVFSVYIPTLCVDAYINPIISKFTQLKIMFLLQVLYPSLIKEQENLVLAYYIALQTRIQKHTKKHARFPICPSTYS